MPKRPRMTASRSRSVLSPCGVVLSLLLLMTLLHTAASIFVLSAPTSMFQNFPANGPIDDATCNIEDLEHANDSQLYTILHDLKETAFFRQFVVDLDHKCPLQSWTKNNEDDEEKCDGGKEELDPDAGPLCGVPGADPFAPLDSNALYSISKGGFQSKEQKDAFAWKQHSDMVVEEDQNCQDKDALLPDSFWMDICSNIQEGDATNVVNLALNPERNTFYNGTHIWKAIYEENCIAVNGDASDMCLEERVLYRLLSGLHTSTTLSIAMNYYPPSKKKGRTDWEPNAQYFMDKLESNPEHIRNLHFSYVVLLRAVRKAAPYLHKYEVHTGNIVEDEKTTVLLKRLLDSTILQSCSNVFEAFDESLMFHESNEDVASLKQNFKGVFHNVSSILDCVQCQQCKLHGKMAMLGYGTALKILFVRPENLELERNEIVALINTVSKMSESMQHVRKLTHLYWAEQQQKSQVPGIPPMVSPTDDITSLDLVDRAVGLISLLGKNELMSFEREAELVQLALDRSPELLILAKHYHDDQDKFLKLSQSIGSLSDTSDAEPDAIIVGSGLAGLTVALNILDRGGSVVVIEKEHLLGGNSNKASSGINACCPYMDGPDRIDTFRNDTIRSAGESARLELIDTLVSNSASAVSWLKERVGVDLSLVAQLGGHSVKRTHRPSNGMVGAEIIYGIQKAVRSYEKSGKVKILTDTRVTRLVKQDDGTVVGVEFITGVDTGSQELRAPKVILATGGFAADRSHGSFLASHRPELLQMPTTAGAFSTGDGIKLATSLGAGTVDMDKVQVHPTGWVDPADPDNTSKILAAELMRGVGGILINEKGDRFCNELGTRAYVTDKMLSHDPKYAETGKWDAGTPVPTFSLVLSSSAAQDGKKHVDLYSHKELMIRLEGVSQLAQWMGLPKDTIAVTLQKYQEDAFKGKDEFGKTTFRGVAQKELEKEVFYAGKVTPVLHYCMGGITIDKNGNVLDEKGSIIPGLHAAGEVTGGVHGVNRLAGNSLLECTVFGTIVGQKVPIKSPSKVKLPLRVQNETKATELRTVPFAELEQHNSPDDCWVAIHGIVYNLTEFAEEHPAGPQSIRELAGKDGTKAFEAVHNERIMEDFEEERMGRLEVVKD